MSAAQWNARDVESSFERWRETLDAAELALLELDDVPDDALPSADLLTCWQDAKEAHVRARARITSRFQPREAQPLVDQYADEYVELLHQHRPLVHDWSAALLARAEWCRELFVEAYDNWDQCARVIECAPTTIGELSAEMDRSLVVTEAYYQKALQAKETLIQLTKLGVGHAIAPANEATRVMSEAEPRQIAIRRLRVARCAPPVIGWDDNGLPRFNEPRPERPAALQGRWYSTGRG